MVNNLMANVAYKTYLNTTKDVVAARKFGRARCTKDKINPWTPTNFYYKSSKRLKKKSRNWTRKLLGKLKKLNFKSDRFQKVLNKRLIPTDKYIENISVLPNLVLRKKLIKCRRQTCPMIREKCYRLRLNRNYAIYFIKKRTKRRLQIRPLIVKKNLKCTQRLKRYLRSCKRRSKYNLKIKFIKRLKWMWRRRWRFKKRLKIKRKKKKVFFFISRKKFKKGAYAKKLRDKSNKYKNSRYTKASTKKWMKRKIRRYRKVFRRAKMRKFKEVRRWFSRHKSMKRKIHLLVLKKIRLIRRRVILVKQYYMLQKTKSRQLEVCQLFRSTKIRKSKSAKKKRYLLKLFNRFRYVRLGKKYYIKKKRIKRSYKKKINKILNIEIFTKIIETHDIKNKRIKKHSIGVRSNNIQKNYKKRTKLLPSLAPQQYNKFSRRPFSKEIARRNTIVFPNTSWTWTKKGPYRPNKNWEKTKQNYSKKLAVNKRFHY